MNPRPLLLASLTLVSAFSSAVFAQNTYPFPSSGNVGIGTTNPQGKLHVAGSFADGVYQDGADRPSFALTGLYPQTVLMAGATGNTNHGATFMLGSFDSGASGAHKHWSIGIAGQNSTFLDIGYHAGTNLNPHAGIRNYNGATILTLLNTGNVGIGTTGPGAKLHVRGATAGEFTALQLDNSQGGTYSTAINLYVNDGT